MGYFIFNTGKYTELPRSRNIISVGVIDSLQNKMISKYY